MTADKATFSVDRPAPPLWLAMVLTAMAGGLGWGIRGQYGHLTGAMIAGVLVSFVLVFLFCPYATSLSAARAVALGTIGVSFGGTETYGQTVGLTHDPQLVGNWEALRWGMLGLAIKGGAWIGFCGAFLGMGLSGFRYRVREMALLLAAMIGLMYLGVWICNQPFDPANRSLPRFYFSADWHWQPDVKDLKPRREVWGGLMAALIGVIVYLGLIRRDRLARNLALWATLGGAIGFPLGQCIQAFHAWNKELFAHGWLHDAGRVINWWNFMETTFGATFGAVLALGVWLNRRKVADLSNSEPVAFPSWLEILLLAAHVYFLVFSEFFAVPMPRGAMPYLRFGFPFSILAIVPMLAIVGGRFWPYLFSLSVVAIPIAGKTLRYLANEEKRIPIAAGWLAYVALPLTISTLAALWLATRPDGPGMGRRYTRTGLLLTTWLYFLLNYAFFFFPWPWQTWTGRTPNALVFVVCAIGLTTAACTIRDARQPQQPTL